MKKIISFFSLLILAVFSVCLIFTDTGPKVVDTKKDELIVTVDNNSSAELSTTRMSLSTSIPGTFLYNNDNVAPITNNDVVEITAITNPTGLGINNLEWNLSWSESSSKLVSEYVSLSVSSNTLVATVGFLKPFDVQIILTCTYKIDNAIYATATIDCYERLQYPGVDFLEFSDMENSSSVFESDDILNFTELSELEEMLLSDPSSNNFRLVSVETALYGVGTIDREFNEEIYLKLSDEVYAYLKDNYDCSQLTCNIGKDGIGPNGTPFMEFMMQLTGFTEYNDSYKSMLASLSSYSHWFDIVYIVSDDQGECFNKIYSLIGFDVISVSDISFDKNEIIF